MDLGAPSVAWLVVVFWVFLGGDLDDLGDPYREVLGILVFLVFLELWRQVDKADRSPGKFIHQMHRCTPSEGK